MKKAACCLLALLWASGVGAQVAPPPFPSIVAPNHPLLRGLVFWHVVQAHVAAGVQWYPLVGRFTGTLMNGAFFHRAVSRLYPGEIICDGNDDVIDLHATTAVDFVNTTFSVSLRYRSTANATTQYVFGRRQIGAATGSYYFRINSDGTGLAAIRGTVGNAAGRVTLRTDLSDGAWHAFTILYTTNTATTANNTITIYHNGVLDQGAMDNSGGDVYVTPVESFGVGASSGTTPGMPLNGAVESVMLHSRALTAVEAAAYAKMTAPAYGGLLVDSTTLAAPVASTATAPVKHRVRIE
jgi:hypothetical protein